MTMILLVFEDYYRGLCKCYAGDLHLQERIRDETIKEQNKTNASLIFNADDIANVTWCYKNYKTPEPDGVPVQFCQIFFLELGFKLMGICNDISKRGRVPISMTKAVTFIIKKRGIRLTLPTKDQSHC